MKLMSWAGRVAALVLVTIVGLELVARLTYGSFIGQPFDAEAAASERTERLAAIQRRLDAGTGDENGADGVGLLRLHPYLGYVGRQGARPWDHEATPYNEFGFLSVADLPYPYAKQNDEFVIGVFGGSVAEGFANLGAEELARELEAADPTLAERGVVVLPLAVAGYKQPQQLFLLQYVLLSGFELDAVVNLDGFNDVVLALDNVSRGDDPLGPSGGHYELLADERSGGLNADSAALLSQIYDVLRHDAEMLGFVQNGVLSQSAFAGLITELWSMSRAAKVQELGDELRATTAGESDRAPMSLSDDDVDNVVDNAVEIWSASSGLMHAAASAAGLVYVHALQPNQYVEGSKPLTDSERETAYSPDNDWAIWARAGYPALIDAGRRLKSEGVGFYDMTSAFAKTTDALYTDDCCHFSRQGHEILARAIADALLREMAEIEQHDPN